MNPSGPAVHFLNIEYFFRLLYDAVFTAHPVSGGGWLQFISQLWLGFSIIAYLITLICIGILAYYSIRLYQVRALTNERFSSTIDKKEEEEKVKHSRWEYIKQLIESPQESDWRQAIIEADIILDEVLTKLGYEGVSVGDKLKSVSRDHFHTLNDAWEAHKVRNEIAHQGSTYKLSDQIAYRTIGHYENVFREFNEI